MARNEVTDARLRRLETFAQALLGVPLEALDDEDFVRAASIQFRYPWFFGEYGQRLAAAIEGLAEATREQRDTLRSTRFREEEREPLLEAMGSSFERLAYSVESLASIQAREVSRSLEEVRDDLESRMRRSEADVLALSDRFREVEAASISTADDLRDIFSPYMAADTLGIPAHEIPLRRLIPVRVYLNEGSSGTISEVWSSVQLFLTSLGFEESAEYPEETGSWYKRFFAKSRKALSRPEVRERLEKGERALDLEYLNSKQAEADKKQAEGAAALITALEPEEEAVVQVGSILLIKAKGEDGRSRTVVRTLTQSELMALERQPDALRSPAEVIGFLRTCGADRNDSAGQAQPTSTEPQNGEA